MVEERLPGPQILEEEAPFILVLVRPMTVFLALPDPTRNLWLQPEEGLQI